MSYATWSAGAHFQGQTNGRPVGTSWPPNTFGTCCGPQWPCQEAESWGQCQCSRAGCCTMMSSRLLSAGQQPYWQRRGTRTMEPLRLLEAAYRIRPLFPTPSGISRPSGYSGYTGHPLLNSFRRRMKTASPSPIMLFPNAINGYLVGGLEHVFFHILEIIVPTGEIIFFRGVGWNHQPDRYKCDLRKKTLETLQPSSVQRPRGKSWGCSISAHAKGDRTKSLAFKTGAENRWIWI